MARLCRALGRAAAALIALSALITVSTAASTTAKKPNIVVILTDDQDLKLNSMDLMENLHSMLIDQGTNFPRHYGHVSQCCPSRTTIWTGKHAHNTNVTTVWEGIAGGAWPQVQALGWYKKYLPVWMQNAGYNTYYSGKIFNEYNHNNYCKPHCAGGFNKADILVGASTYYYYNSSYTHYDGKHWSVHNNVTGYSTDQVADYVASYIEEVAHEDKPFFVVAAPVAPHAPHVPKEEYKHLYPDAQVPRTSNFNPNNRSGVATVWTLDKLSENNVEVLDGLYRSRLQCLKSVDDMIGTIMDKLDSTGVLDNTYIIYTSDNGYHLGNHRLQGGKDMCFEEDINLPFVIRGPGVAKGKTSPLITGHIDLAPTIVELAGGDPQEIMTKDGVDFDGTPISFPLETDEDDQRNIAMRGDATHVEQWGPFLQEGPFWKIGVNYHNHSNIYKALRIQGNGYNLLYSVWCANPSHELYDMSWDTQQMTNLHPHAPSENGSTPYSRGMDTLLGVPTWKLIYRLDAVVLVLKTCSGDQCRWPWLQLHPDGSVKNLEDALKPEYDEFYAHSYAVAKVGWLECYGGLNATSSSTLYSIANEEPVWVNERIVQAVMGDSVTAVVSTSGTSSMAAGGSWLALLFCVWSAVLML